MKLHDLRPNAGKKKARKRVGRGIAAGQGKTAGRGTKGRTWVSPPGQSIHTTLVVRPTTDQLKRLNEGGILWQRSGVRGAGEGGLCQDCRRGRPH